MLIYEYDCALYYHFSWINKVYILKILTDLSQILPIFMPKTPVAKTIAVSNLRIFFPRHMLLNFFFSKDNSFCVKPPSGPAIIQMFLDIRLGSFLPLKSSIYVLSGASEKISRNSIDLMTGNVYRTHCFDASLTTSSSFSCLSS